MLLFLAAPAAAGPLMRINRLEIDLGVLEAGAVLVDTSFLIKNHGDAPLVFEAQSTCDCLTVNPEKISLAPGKAVSLRVTLDTENEQGRLRKTLYLLTNDPRFPSVPLLVLAEVRAFGKTEKGLSGGSGGLSQDRPAHAAFYYFHSFTCRECIDLKRDFFPGLEERLKKKFRVISRDLDREGMFPLLLSFRDTLQPGETALPVVVLGRHYLAGFSRIRKELPRLLAGKGPYPLLPEKEAGNVSSALVRFSVWPVLAAGLVDGINPCAFAAVIFLLSYLSFLKKTRKTILLTGIFFIAAVFITYFLIGFGLFSGLRRLPSFIRIARYVYLALAFFTFFLAYRSFRDFLLARQGRYGEMGLQLSGGLKKRIHESIRVRTRAGWIIGSSIVLGVTVSFFELACTGQLYLPALVSMTRFEPVRAGAYLFLYNLLFILPLFLVFILFYRGVSSGRIAAFFQKKVAIIKLLTTLMFIVLGLVLFFNAL